MEYSKRIVPSWIDNSQDPAVQKMSEDALALYSELLKGSQTLVLRRFDYKEEGTLEDRGAGRFAISKKLSLKIEADHRLIKKKWMVDENR